MLSAMKNKKYYILEAGAIGILLLPVLITSLYSLPAMDDYSASVTYLSYRTGTLTGMMEYLNIFFKQWGGCYFSVMIEFFIAPFARGGVQMLQWANFLGELFFYVSLFCLISYLYSTFCTWQHKRHAAIITYGLLVFLIVSNDSMPSIITWWCVVSVYIIVAACMFLGILFYLKALQENKRRYCILSAVLGFLASGSALNVAALNCGIYFILAVLGICFWKNKVNSIVMTAGAWLGGLVNVLAPGNYVRRNTYAEELHIIYALKLSVFKLWERGQYLIFHTPFILILLILLVIALLCVPQKCKFAFPYPALVVFFFILAVVVVNYPVFLGYGDVTGWFPEHCIWVMDLTIYFGAFLSVYYIAGWVKIRNLQPEPNKNMIWVITVCVIFYLCNLGIAHNLNENATVKMLKNITNGTYTAFTDYWEGILNEIETSEDSNVVVYRESQPENGEMIKYPDIREDSSHWVNTSIARFYGKESVSVHIAASE